VVLSVHAPYYINLNGDEEKWPRLRKYLMDAAYFGNLAGATDIIFHPGTYFGRPDDEVLEWSCRACKPAWTNCARPATRSLCAPRSAAKPPMLGSLADVLTMANAIPGVVPCIDFAHCMPASATAP